jgi:phosphoribosylamine--glycine ligase
MKILFISKQCIAGDLANQLVKEGHDVKLFFHDKKAKHNFDYMIPKTENWRTELGWVGKDGLIIFDDIGYGKTQDQLRKKGYIVFGGSELGDKLENNREFGQQIFADAGLKTTPLIGFNNVEDAILYVQAHPDDWVVKQNFGNKFINYVGYYRDGRDVISLLTNYLQEKMLSREGIILHKRIRGIEIGVGRYFNGTDWVGPIEFNIEHTALLPGDIGPMTSEMGTLAWYGEDENNKLYQETLVKLKPFLEKSGFRGDFEVNCIVNEDGVFPLEPTCRFGSPIVHLHSEIHNSPWGEFLYAVASGQDYDLKYKKGYGVVVLLAVPPFPFNKKISNPLFGVDIHFDNFSKEDFDHIHFEEVSLRVGSKNKYYISNGEGYILYVTGMGNTIEEAQNKVYSLTKRVVVPKMMYRNDIGSKFAHEDCETLKKWGYL